MSNNDTPPSILQNPVNALYIASYFIQKGIQEGLFVSHLKLQKLIYIAHGWHLAFFNQPLIDSTVEAWQFGPVIPVVYNELKHWGSRDFTFNPIGMSLRHSETFPDTLEVVDGVWHHYKTYKANELVELTHEKGTPWDAVFWGGTYKAPIPDPLTQNYYVGLLEQNKQKNKDY